MQLDVDYIVSWVSDTCRSTLCALVIWCFFGIDLTKANREALCQMADIYFLLSSLCFTREASVRGKHCLSCSQRSSFWNKMTRPLRVNAITRDKSQFGFLGYVRFSVCFSSSKDISAIPSKVCPKVCMTIVV